MLLIVHHSPSRSLTSLTDALVSGANDEELAGVDVEVRAAADATADEVNAADGILLCTPANFGYMAGMMKDFFDRNFLAMGGSLSDDGSGAESTGATKDYGLCVHGRYDVTGAVRSVQSIVGALPWRQAAPVLEVLGDVGEDELERAYELGATLAALQSG